MRPNGDSSQDTRALPAVMPRLLRKAPNEVGATLIPAPLPVDSGFGPV